jgi:hypothetical protein
MMMGGKFLAQISANETSAAGNEIGRQFTPLFRISPVA